MHKSGLLILGFGGHARSVADVALASGIKQLCFIDSNARPNESLGEFSVRTSWDAELPKGWSVMPASGDNLTRKAQCEWVSQQGWPLATLIAPTSTIGYGATVGAGTLVAHHAHIGPMATVGMGCIVNTGAIVEHECDIADFTHIAVNATVAGRSRVGSFCFIGASSTVIDSVRITDSVILGAGACAHRDIDKLGTYVGIPAQRLDRDS